MEFWLLPQIQGWYYRESFYYYGFLLLWSLNASILGLVHSCVP